MERLKELRQRTGLSRETLAAGADMSSVALWRYETGRRSPTADQLEKLASALDVEVADFFPKAQAPLPLDFGVGAGLGAGEDLEWFDMLGASFVEVWTSYVRQRVEGWEEVLPESVRAISIFSGPSGRPLEEVPGLFEELDADRPLAIDIKSLSGVALSELDALVSAVVTAAELTRIGGVLGPEEGEPPRVWRACLDHTTIGLPIAEAREKWRISAQVAWGVAGKEPKITEDPAEAIERSERVAEENQKVVALYEEHLSA